jgi:hypothetical protein
MLDQLMEQNITLTMKKVRNFQYEICMKPPLGRKVLKLGLSGGALVVHVGGGYLNFLEFLDRKGMLSFPDSRH